MNWRSVAVLLAHELRLLIRDRRTVIFALALPLIIIPLSIYASSSVSARRERNRAELVYKYAVAGTNAEMLRRVIAETRQYPVSEPSLADFKFEEVPVRDPASGLQHREIHFYIEALTGKETDRLPKEDKKDEPQQDQVLARESRLSGVPLFLVYYRGDWDASQSGESRIRQFLQRARELTRFQVLSNGGYSTDPQKLLPSSETDLAKPGQTAGSQVGRFLTPFLVMLLLSGGSVVALDIIAGEKERGSLETLLTTAVRHREIVAAKQLAIFAVALVITLVQFANILLCVTFGLVELPKTFVIKVPPGTILTLLILFLPVAAFVSALLLSISAYARSYKEAQLYFFPVYLASLVPAMASVLPGISLRSAIVLVPLANISVAAREVLVGRFDWIMLTAATVAMSAAAVGMARVSARMLSEERLVTVSEAEAADVSGGPMLFPKHVLRWYAVLLVVMFTAAVNVSSLSTLRRQIVFNEIVVFLGGAALMVWRYRLPLREALALRPVKPLVWLAVALLIPSGNIVGIGVFRLANLVIPVPRQVFEQFGSQVLPEDIPAWQLLIMIAILPGICEEIAFRGPLLYGLRRRFRPVTLAIVVGLVFGFFHVALFRIIPTAFLGVILTAVALLTGSILPGMLIHAGNNAFAFWASTQGLGRAYQDWTVYSAAALVFCLAFYILFRERTPYPGLRVRSKD